MPTVAHGDLLLTAGALVHRRHVHDAAGSDVEGHLDLKHSAGGGGDPSQLKLAEQVVFFCHRTLPFIHLRGGGACLPTLWPQHLDPKFSWRAFLIWSSDYEKDINQLLFITIIIIKVGPLHACIQTAYINNAQAMKRCRNLWRLAIMLYKNIVVWHA